VQHKEQNAMTTHTQPSGQQLAPYLTAQRSSRTAALLILTVVLSPATLLGGSLLYAVARIVNMRVVWRILAALAVLGIAVLAWQWHKIAADGQTLWEAAKPLYGALQKSMAASRGNVGEPVVWRPLLIELGWHLAGLWRWGLFGIPFVALYLNGTRLKTAEEQERRKQEEAQQALAQRSRAAAHQSTKAPHAIKQQLVFGASVEGDLPWTRGPWVCYPPDVLGRHLALIGASGQGKSETALRLAAGAAQVYGWQVFFLDAKGDRAMAQRFWTAMEAAGKTRLAHMPARPFDAWRGDASALLNRLLSILDWSEPYVRS
jgi:hypothetical protein